MQIFHQTDNSVGNYSYNIYLYDSLYYSYHFHKNIELTYVYSGRALYSVSGVTQILEPGDFALCLSNQIHSVQSLEPSKIWIGVFSEDFVREFKNQLGDRVGAQFHFRCQPTVLEFLKANLLIKEPSDLLMLKAGLYAVCSEYLRQVELVPNPTGAGLMMGEIVQYVDANFKSPITLRDLSEHLGYEYCYMSRTFHQLFSMSFNDYLNSYRMDCALELLSKTDLSVTEIAMESGFQSIRSFNDRFRKLTGTTPTAAFRKK